MTRRCIWSILILVGCCISATCSQGKRSPRMTAIGITQFIFHPDLDKSVKGFEKALADAGYVEGVNVVFDRQNAQGEVAIAMAIAQKFRDEDLDLVLVINTPSAQAMVRTIRRTPVVFCAVTDPVDAGIVPKDSAPGKAAGGNVTGVSDRWPVARQLETYLRFVPSAKRWGTIYNPGDANSMVHIREMREAAGRLGLDLEEATITGSSETLQAAQSLARNVQAVNITSDFAALSAIQSIVKVCNDHRIPVFTGEPGSVALGAVAAYGLDYSLLGRAAGEKAVRILKGERPGAIPWGPVGTYTLTVNPAAAAAQGLAIPPELLRQAQTIIGGGNRP